MEEPGEGNTTPKDAFSGTGRDAVKRTSKTPTDA